MNANAGMPSDRKQLVWERGEPIERSIPVPLSRRAVVRAAIELADKQGLQGVSLRKIGAALNAGPMRLYGYIDTKDELLDLLVDEIYREMATVDLIPGSWRAKVVQMYRQMREAALRHPWFVELSGGRPHIGPNALAFTDKVLAALHGGKVADISSSLRALNAYAIGAIRTEIAEATAEHDSGLSKPEWQRMVADYMAGALANGRLPMIAKLTEQASQRQMQDEFEAGLSWLLNGMT